MRMLELVNGIRSLKLKDIYVLVAASVCAVIFMFVVGLYTLWGCHEIGAATICFGMAIPIIIFNRRISIGVREILVIMGWTLSYYITGADYPISHIVPFYTMMIVLVAGICDYGKFITIRREYIFVAMIFAIVTGFSTHALFEIKIIFSTFNEMSYHDLILDRFTGIIHNATQIIFSFIPITGLFFFAVIFWKKYKLICSCIIVANVLFLYTTLYIMSRTTVCIFIVQLFVGCMLYVYNNRWDKRKMRVITRCIGVLLILVILAVVATAVLVNAGVITLPGVVEYTLHRNGGILGNIRFVWQREVLKNMFKYPMGTYGTDVYDFGFAHNWWLDILKDAGLIPFTMIAVYTVLSIYDVICFVRNKLIKDEYKYILVGVWSVFMLYYTIEPASNGYGKMVIPWIIINTMVYRVNRGYKKK